MKTRPATLRPQFAFTLIELITVIAIIAILMALLFPAMSGARDSARRSKASSVVRAVVNATKSYLTDYGKYPPIPAALVTGGSGGSGGGGDSAANKSSYYSYGDKEVAKCKVENDQLFDVLRAIAREPNGDHKLNRRQQKYFEEAKANDVKNPREGFVDGREFPEDIQGQLLDPWGKQYCILLDADGDEVLDISEFFQDQKDPIRFSAAAFSMGKNLEIGGKGYVGR